MAWRSIFLNLSTFHKAVIITTCVTFFLIFIGGFVRVTGAGLGCPDWPRCFGLWIPPLTASDLPSAYNPDNFNVFKTWTEYINRLTGVIVGFLILLTFVMSVKYIRDKPIVFAGATLALVMVLFQGWLGGQVVKSGLEGWMISVHMVTAILILYMLIWTLFFSLRDRIHVTLDPDVRNKLALILIFLTGFTMLQIIFGTQVREGLESVKTTFPSLERADWITEVGIMDTLHRSFSWLLLGLTGALHYLVYKNRCSSFFLFPAKILSIVVLIQILSGTGLVYLGIPSLLQLFHLWTATFMAVVPYLLLLIVFNAKFVKSQ